MTPGEDPRPAPAPTSRVDVVTGDALDWLREHPAQAGCSVVTSLPDVAELGVTVEAWRPWFAEAARLCLLATPDDGLTIFFQTDRRHEGRWISKAGLVLAAAAALDVPLLWHKVVLRQPAGTAILGRPGYSHLLAFSRAAVPPPDLALPDVLPDLGDVPWSHSMGTAAVALALRAIRATSPSTTTILAPFCGEGTALAVAVARGFDAVGVERNRKRAEKARRAGATEGTR